MFRAWSKLKTPTRVSEPVIAAVRDEIAGVPGPTLLLGVTHGLSALGSDLTALDRSATLVRTEWPGNVPNRRAIVGDWTMPPFTAGSFATCIGDGVLNSLAYPHQVSALLASVGSILRSPGRFVCRVFTAPDVPQSVDEVVRAVWRRGVGRFQILKFELASAIASENGDPNIAVATTFKVFERNFPDRDRLAAVTGWDRREIDTIDVYRASTVSYSFPTRRQYEAIVPAAFSQVRFVEPKGYDLAQRYPLLVIDRG